MDTKLATSDAGGDTNGKLTYPAHMAPPKPSITSSFSHHTPHFDTITGQQKVSRLQSAYIEIILIYYLHCGDKPTNCTLIFISLKILLLCFASESKLLILFFPKTNYICL
jgi:hypothetical protein